MSIRLTWWGHSAWQIETDAHSILIDPYLSDSPVCNVSAERIKADVILVTHGHADHIGDTVPIAKRTGATVVAMFEITNWLRRHGLQHLEAMNTGARIEMPFGAVRMTQAWHSSSLPDGTYGGPAAGYVVELKRDTGENAEPLRIYHAGDTGLFGDMKLIGRDALDVALLPIGDRFTMGPDDALLAAELLWPKHVIPMHYDTWAPIAQDVAAWAERVKQGTSFEPHVIKPGESVEF